MTVTKIKPDMVEDMALKSELVAFRDLFVGIPFVLPFVPADPWWLQLYGQLINVEDYPVLSAKYGTTYGGDGVTTVRLPDYRGRGVIGLDAMGGVAANRMASIALLGAVGGLENITLTTNQIPTHKHGVGSLSIVPAGSHKHTMPNASSSSGSLGGAGQTPVGGGTNDTSTAPNHTHGVSGEVADAGGGQAHSNVQPSIAQYWCVLAY